MVVGSYGTSCIIARTTLYQNEPVCLWTTQEGKSMVYLSRQSLCAVTMLVSLDNF